MNSTVSKILSLASGLIGLIAIYFLARIIMEGDDAAISAAARRGALLFMLPTRVDGANCLTCHLAFMAISLTAASFT